MILEVFGRLCLFIRRLKDKAISTYQLSRIRHGIGCEIRGGASSFQGNIIFGDYVTIGTNSNFMATGADLIIGNKVLFGPHCFIITGNHQINRIGLYITDVTQKTECCDEPVVIEDDVWIGAGTIILKGVTISKGSVIGAGSVVTKSTRPYSVNAGNPCKEIKMRFTEEEIHLHEEKIKRLGEINE